MDVVAGGADGSAGNQSEALSDMESQRDDALSLAVGRRAISSAMTRGITVLPCSTAQATRAEQLEKLRTEVKDLEDRLNKASAVPKPVTDEQLKQRLSKVLHSPHPGFSMLTRLVLLFRGRSRPNPNRIGSGNEPRTSGNELRKWKMIWAASIKSSKIQTRKHRSERVPPSQAALGGIIKGVPLFSPGTSRQDCRAVAGEGRATGTEHCSPRVRNRQAEGSSPEDGRAGEG